MGALEIEDFEHECYRKETYLKAYTPVVYPMNGQKMWSTTGRPPIQPPNYHKQLGRPKKDAQEKGKRSATY